jgi:hypothetical protein
MSISPFHAAPASSENEARRARLVVALVTLGIAASLLAYAVAPSVRHVVGRAAHSVTHVLDHDHPAPTRTVTPAHPPRAGTGAGSADGQAAHGGGPAAR